tara:strand:- start:70 stop:492 length:423 start_codon:yes stop_codon:yes gene_type:complete
MLNQDFIMRQIQQMTQVLSKILIQVLKLKKSGSATEIVSFTNGQLKEILDFNIDEFSSALEEKGLAYFMKEKHFDNENLNIFADILYELAEQCFEDPDTHDQSLKFYAQSLQIYEFIEQVEKTYSIDRNVKITKIKDILE